MISFPPKYSISQVVNRMKQLTTQYLYSYKDNYLNKFYWKKNNILWSESYYIDTLGLISESQVTEYIKNQ